MTIVNRRNAVVGWAVWNVTKRAASRKARSARPSLEGRKPNKSLIAAAGALAAGAGILALVRARKSIEE